MKYIDLERYPRRTHFDYFRRMDYPYVGMTANVEVTNLVRRAKELGGSTFLACLWAAARAANAVPELRQRIVEDRLAEVEHCNTSHTVALPDHTFCSCRTDCRMSLEEFLVYGHEKQEKAKQNGGFGSSQEERLSLIFVSCVPWVAFTQVIQPTPGGDDSTPRIVFGKFIKEGEKIMMPLAIQCNHAIVDGYHIGRFYQIFQEIADSI